ncbi:Aspartic proteinase CDR1 [Apostasia shenzhenica]|uniref:Aspartic proteinase CDR1 n=1 Tax=Apostasia shenzhenica TaxID=1088818 RepID=A0A2I0A3J4_9ASPA|nr:Aspartic proteinase CDR1 [Apostasia shenzhenica]
MASSTTPSLGLSLFIVSAAAILPMLCTGEAFSVELIPRDSPSSPLHNPDSTPFSRILAAAGSSRVRAAYFINRILKAGFSSSLSAVEAVDDLNLEITSTAGVGAYLMNFELGTPPRKMMAVADTGSDLIWVQCKPCDSICFHQNSSIFNPRDSSTYKAVSCHADYCLYLNSSARCTKTSSCHYRYGYGDGSVYDGLLASETIGLYSSGFNRPVQFPKTRFGCTHWSNGTSADLGGAAGIIGLGGGKLSLIRQMGSAIGSKFSYCLPSFLQTSATGRLNLGSAARVSGANAVSTPLIRIEEHDTYYILGLEQIIVAGHSIAVNRSLNLGGRGGNTIIDSGTTLTFVDNTTLKAVASVVASNVRLPQVKDPTEYFHLCFNVSGAAERGLPKLTFRFSGGALVVLPRENAYVQVAENTECLALIPNAVESVNIFGNIAQQNFHIGYDLENMKLTFVPVADCSKL